MFVGLSRVKSADLNEVCGLLHLWETITFMGVGHILHVCEELPPFVAMLCANVRSIGNGLT